MGLAASRQEAFWESCGFGHLERAKYLLEEGDIDVNWVSYANDCCPIHVASQGKPDIVKLLLDHKCDVNVRDNRGNLPLHHAAMKGHADIVQTLIDAGSEVNAQEKNGWTALHNAAYWCHLDVVNILLKSGCDVNIHNKDERTALHECARSQQSDDKTLGDIARTLIKAGCSINSRSSDWGEADLTGLMYAAFHKHPDVASAFIDAGCELNDVGTTFWSALHWAADRGNDELVYILLEAGIDPTLRDMRGETAVDRARSDEIKEVLSTAVELHKEVNRIKNPIIKPASQLVKPVEPFKPKCDANFKSESFLPKDWKPSSSVDVKNLINEKKRRLAAMTSQKYRTELARRTSTEVIKDADVQLTDVEKAEKIDSEQSVSDKEETKIKEGKDGEASASYDSKDVISDKEEDQSLACSSLSEDDNNSKDIEDTRTGNSCLEADQNLVCDGKGKETDISSSNDFVTDESDENVVERETSLAVLSSDAVAKCDTVDVELPVNTEIESEPSESSELTKSKMVSDAVVSDTNNEQIEKDKNNQVVNKVDKDEQKADETGDAKVSGIQY